MNLPLVVDFITVFLLVFFIGYAIYLNMRIRRLQEVLQGLKPGFEALIAAMSDHEQKSRLLIEDIKRRTDEALSDHNEEVSPSSFYSIAKKVKK
jgi:hypothetical protein